MILGIEPSSTQALLHYFDKKTGRKSKKPPQFAKRGMNAPFRSANQD